jgi:NhaP-type Na+/H+ or K+/H+ antiporter
MNICCIQYSIVFGEAVLNDAVAIVLYKTFESFLSVEFSDITVFFAFTKFLFISVGSIILGFLVGVICAIIFRNAPLLDGLPHMENSLILLFAYSSYFVVSSAYRPFYCRFHAQ